MYTKRNCKFVTNVRIRLTIRSGVTIHQVHRCRNINVADVLSEGTGFKLHNIKITCLRAIQLWMPWHISPSKTPSVPEPLNRAWLGQRAHVSRRPRWGVFNTPRPSPESDHTDHPIPLLTTNHSTPPISFSLSFHFFHLKLLVYCYPGSVNPISRDSPSKQPQKFPLRFLLSQSHRPKHWGLAKTQ